MPYNRIWSNKKLTNQQKHIISNKEKEEKRRREQFEKDQEKKKNLEHWIEDNLLPIKSFNDKYNSYQLKGIAERDTGNYYTNDDFKYAMVRVGFKVKNEKDNNWIFNVSQKSKAFRK